MQTNQRKSNQYDCNIAHVRCIRSANFHKNKWSDAQYVRHLMFVKSIFNFR